MIAQLRVPDPPGPPRGSNVADSLINEFFAGAADSRSPRAGGGDR